MPQTHKKYKLCSYLHVNGLSHLSKGLLYLLLIIVTLQFDILEFCDLTALKKLRGNAYCIQFVHPSICPAVLQACHISRIS